MIDGEKVRQHGSSNRHFKLECVKKALQPIFVNSEDPENQLVNWDPPADLNHNHVNNNKKLVPQRLIQKIRSQMIRRSAECPEHYYPEDLEKIKWSDWAVARFIPDDYSGPGEKIVESIDSCLKWRKEYGIREIRLNSFPSEFFTIGLFELGTNADNGMPVIYIRACKYKKISELAEQFERFGSCLYETLDSNPMTGQQRLTAFLDLKGVSLESVDVPTFRHFLDLMFNYFPNILQQAFVVDVSWFLRPIVFLILKVIPEHYTKNVRIVTRAELSTSYDHSGVPEELGGTMITGPLPADGSAISLDDFVRLHGIPASVLAKAKKIYKLP